MKQFTFTNVQVTVLGKDAKDAYRRLTEAFSTIGVDWVTDTYTPEDDTYPLRSRSTSELFNDK